MILNLRGGFGNQCLQLARANKGRGLDGVTINQFAAPLAWPLNELPNVDVVQSAWWSTFGGVTRKVLSRICRRELDIEVSLLQDGYFQYGDIDSDLPVWLSSYLKGRLKLVEKVELVVHIRGGDYATLKSQRTYCKLTAGYYINAIKRLGEQDELKGELLVITNDKEAAGEIVGEIKDAFPDFSIRFSGGDVWDDFSLLCRAKYCVMANSSFSMVSRMLREYPEGACTIYPRPWYIDPQKESPVISRFVAVNAV